MKTKQKQKKAKYKEIYDYIFRKINTGDYKPGSRIPTEIELVSSFNASRPTVSRALRDLENKGLIERIQGSGSFISENKSLKNITLGLLAQKNAITSHNNKVHSIFNQIIPEISGYASKNDMALVLGNSPSIENKEKLFAEAFAACNDFIQRGVKGIFFLPFPTTDQNQDLNKKITDKFDRAGIQVVLLDRDITDDICNRSKYDIVGIDNSRASYTLTQHLVNHGCKRIAFFADLLHNSVTIDRIYGYERALTDNNLPLFTIKLRDLFDKNDLRSKIHLIKLKDFDGIICVNDELAFEIMNICANNDIKIPEQIKFTGFDDLPITAHLNPPLTTIHQPVSSLANEAVKAMLSRMKDPEEPPKDIRIHGNLITRRSCGC